MFEVILGKYAKGMGSSAVPMYKLAKGVMMNDGIY